MIQVGKTLRDIQRVFLKGGIIVENTAAITGQLPWHNAPALPADRLR